MSLYLKYRPKTIDELDLTAVRESFKEIVAANQVAHAYLFTGPRGAGKTSSARILARVINCEHNDKHLAEPCNECEACRSILGGGSLDFVEIDAASNRGIDDIRELKEKIRLAPSDLKYKVYIIDEVHMLTTEAFNALLKTLEEPPAHAVFILCTTETHKVPETIQSRCVRVTFTKATPEEMQRSFARVVSGEGKEVESPALAYLASSVDGSFRDGVKILDRVLAKHNKVNLTIMEEALVGLAGFSVVPLAKALVAKDAGSALTILHTLTSQGLDLSYLVVSLMKALRDELVSGADKELVSLVFALDEVARKIATSPVPELLLEMVIIEWGSATLSKSPGTPGKKNPGSSEEQSSRNPEPAKKSVKTDGLKTETPSPQQLANADHTEVWQKLLMSLNGDSITMGALLSKATPAQLAGDILTIQVEYGFHRDQIMSDKVRRKLEDALEAAVGRRLRVTCEVATLTKPTSAKTKDEVTPVDLGDTIDEAIAIFS